MTKEDFSKIIAHDREGNGPCGRTERIRCLLPLLLEQVEGDVLEIGAGYGQTTVVMMEATVAMDRRVYVLDPWPEQFDGGVNGYRFEDFQRCIACYIGINPRYEENKHLLVARVASQSPEAHMLVETLEDKLAFALVDGDQTSPEPVLSDLRMLGGAKCRVICVDDIGRSQVAEAVKQFVADAPYEHYVMECSRPHETYLLRRDSV